MSQKNCQQRTINMPETRRRQLALIAAYLGVRSSEEVIQTAIGEFIAKLADQDRTLFYMLARSAGEEWESVELDAMDKVFSKVTASK